VLKNSEQKIFFVSSGIQTCVFSVCEQLLRYHLHKTIKSITGHKKLKKLDNVKLIIKKGRIGIIKIPKQEEDTGNLQILLHLRYLF